MIEGRWTTKVSKRRKGTGRGWTHLEEVVGDEVGDLAVLLGHIAVDDALRSV